MRLLPLLMPACLVAALSPVAVETAQRSSAPLALPQERHLKNVRQLTFEGENAEAYFSFDGRKLIFQSTVGHGCDQIYTMNVDGSDRRLVSTGAGRTTCSFY